MTFVHSRLTVVKFATEDLSDFSKTTNFERSRKQHDTTTYGKESMTYAAGLKDGKITVGGTFDDSTADGPVIYEQYLDTGAAGEFVLQPAGTGAGKPQKTCQANVMSYNVSDPVDDMVQWTAELQITGDVDVTPQV
jgi:hypothetical protein